MHLCQQCLAYGTCQYTKHDFWPLVPLLFGAIMIKVTKALYQLRNFII